MAERTKKIPRAFDGGLGFIYTHPWRELYLSRCCSELIGRKVIASTFNLEAIMDIGDIAFNPLYKLIEGLDDKKYDSGILVATVNPVLEITEGGKSREFPDSSKMNEICNAYQCAYSIHNIGSMGHIQ